MLDLRDLSVVTALGIVLDDLTAGRAAAQDLAARAGALGAEGMVVPSAARHGHWNLVVFPAGFSRLASRRSRATHPRPPG